MQYQTKTARAMMTVIPQALDPSPPSSSIFRGHPTIFSPRFLEDDDNHITCTCHAHDILSPPSPSSLSLSQESHAIRSFFQIISNPYWKQPNSFIFHNLRPLILSILYWWSPMVLNLISFSPCQLKIGREERENSFMNFKFIYFFIEKF